MSLLCNRFINAIYSSLNDILLYPFSFLYYSFGKITTQHSMRLWPPQSRLYCKYFINLLHTHTRARKCFRMLFGAHGNWWCHKFSLHLTRIFWPWWFYFDFDVPDTIIIIIIMIHNIYPLVCLSAYSDSRTSTFYRRTFIFISREKTYITKHFLVGNHLNQCVLCIRSKSKLIFYILLCH